MHEYDSEYEKQRKKVKAFIGHVAPEEF